jgi:hypothetical protein
MNRTEMAQVAAEIVRFVVENGRVESGNDESLRVEVEFEAMERGYADASEIADLAVELAR